MSRASLVILVLLLVSAPSTPLVSSEGRPAPFSDYRETPLNRVLFPRIGAPALAEPGSRFEAFVAWIADEVPDPEAASWSASLESLYSDAGSYAPTVESQEFTGDSWRLILALPSDVEPGLYNLSLSAGGVRYVEPNSVYVLEPGQSSLKVAVATESHFSLRRAPGDVAFRESFIDVLNTAQALGVDAFIHLGDLLGNVYDEETFAAFYRLLVQSRVPVFLVQGNADWDTVEHDKYYWDKYLGPIMRYRAEYLWITVEAMNTDTGRVSDELLDRVEADLAGAGTPVKVLIVQYPYWQNSPNSQERLPDILTGANVTLVLFGQDGTDEVLEPPDRAVLHVAPKTTHRAVSGGFRILEISESGRVRYWDESVPNGLLNVSYLQPNDGSSESMAVRVEYGVSDKDYGLSTFEEGGRLILKLPVLLRDVGRGISVEGAEVIWQSRRGGKVALLLRAEVSPGGDLTVKVLQGEDATAPTIRVYPDVVVRKATLYYELSDVGLGAESVEFYFSEDNSSWAPCPVKVVEEHPLYYVEATRPVMYYKAVVRYAAGNVGTYYGQIEFPDLGPTWTTPPPAERGRLNLIAVGVAALAAIAAVAALLMRRR